MAGVVGDGNVRAVRRRRQATDRALGVALRQILVVDDGEAELFGAMLTALKNAGITWSATMEVANVSVAEAAIDAGVGVCAALQNMPLHVAFQLEQDCGLPKLPSLDYYLYRRSGADVSLVSALSELITEAIDAPH